MEPKDDVTLLRRDDLAQVLSRFGRGRESLEETQRWLLPVLLQDGANVEEEDRDLFLKVVFLLEDDSISTGARRQMSARLAHVLELGSGLQLLEQWFDVIVDRDRILGLMRPFITGKLTRTGYLSAIANMRLTPMERELLAARDRSTQEWLFDILSREDYGTLLPGPPGWTRQP